MRGRNDRITRESLRRSVWRGARHRRATQHNTQTERKSEMGTMVKTDEIRRRIIGEMYRTDYAFGVSRYAVMMLNAVKGNGEEEIPSGYSGLEKVLLGGSKRWGEYSEKMDIGERDVVRILGMEKEDKMYGKKERKKIQEQAVKRAFWLIWVEANCEAVTREMYTQPRTVKMLKSLRRGKRGDENRGGTVYPAKSGEEIREVSGKDQKEVSGARVDRKGRGLIYYAMLLLRRLRRGAKGAVVEKKKAERREKQ